MSDIFGRLVEGITLWLVKAKAISANEIESYRFGVEVTLLKSMHFISYIAIALCMGKALEFIVIFSVFGIFRRNTGGFHARTRVGCYFFSCTVIAMALYASGLGIAIDGFLHLFVMVELLVMVLISPVKNENRGLDAEETCYFRKRLCMVTGIFSIVYFAVLISGGRHFSWWMAIGVSMNAMLTILGKLQYAIQCHANAEKKTGGEGEGQG